MSIDEVGPIGSASPSEEAESEKESEDDGLEESDAKRERWRRRRRRERGEVSFVLSIQDRHHPPGKKDNEQQRFRYRYELGWLARYSSSAGPAKPNQRREKERSREGETERVVRIQGLDRVDRRLPQRLTRLL